MNVTSSFLCENCGIKVSAAEGPECPGCGFNAAGTSGDPRNETPGASFVDSGETSFSKFGSKDRFVSDHLVACEAMFEEETPRILQMPVLQEVIEKTKEKITTAPDKESSCRLNSYLSEMYRQAESYHESFEAAKIGVESNEEFYKHQSHNSILDSLLNLKRFDDLENWLNQSQQAKFPDANYYKIKYLTCLERFDEALEICDSHYASDIDFLNANRSDILIKAQRFEEAELALNKLIAKGPRAEYTANWINTLAFGILIPQRRYFEAERVLISAICTKSEREKINAFSNLAMLALNMNEFKASKRFAKLASTHPENSIASESRLTLCRLEEKSILENESSTTEDWLKLFDQVKQGLELADFDDTPSFLELLITSGERSNQMPAVIKTVNVEFEKIKTHQKWSDDSGVRERFQIRRVELLSKFYLEKSEYLELDKLFQEVLEEGSTQGFDGLLEYLKTPFAAINLRKASLKITNERFLALWSSFETQEEILYSLAKYSEESILVGLSENLATPDSICELITKKKDIDLDFALSGRPTMSIRLIKLLSKSDFEAVRKLIASRSDLDEDTFRALATDAAMLVRDAIRENPACPAEIRALAALGSL